MTRSNWFDSLLRVTGRLPGPRWLQAVVATVVITVPMHIAIWLDRPREFGDLRLDLVVGAAAPVLIVWAAVALNDVALRSLARLGPALDPGASSADIAADLTRTPGAFAGVALVIGVLAGVASVVQSPGNWGVDPANLGIGYWTAIATSVLTDVFMLGFVAHLVHQLQVVARVHRDSVRIELFQLEPLYGFSDLTAWAGVVILGVTFGLLVTLSLTTGRFILQSASDIALTGGLVAMAIACFVVPLLGLHERIVEEKRRRRAAVNEIQDRIVAHGSALARADDFQGLAALKDAALLAESAVTAVQRISTWPWRPETARGFASAVILPIILWLLFQGLGRVLPG